MTFQIDRLYHVPNLRRKVHLAYMNGDDLVTACRPDLALIVVGCDGERDATREDAEWFDSHDLRVTCKICLRWSGL